MGRDVLALEARHIGAPEGRDILAQGEPAEPATPWVTAPHQTEP